MKVRETIRKRIKDLHTLATEASRVKDEKTVLETIIRANECYTILKLL